jgi:ankyrin repeat protein
MGLTKEMDLPTKVFDASKNGYLQQLKRFLENKPPQVAKSVVATKTQGSTPLIMACKNGHLPVVEYIVEKCNADVEQVGTVSFDGENIEGAPPLWCAAAAGHFEIVKYLVRKKAKVNNTTDSNSTPLRAACFDGHFEIVRYLIDHKADIEIANRHGHTCLMIACYKGHTKIVKYLIDKGADINRKSLKGMYRKALALSFIMFVHIVSSLLCITYCIYCCKRPKFWGTYFAV